MEIRIENYTKVLKKHKVLDRINYCFEGGKIYGVYGKNGSGKTMLLRAVSGLLFPSEGSVSVDGKVLRRDIDFPESIGLLIETPWFPPQYTGFENLKILASIQGKTTDEEIRDALIKTGLDPEDKRRVKKYSLGMKQRLGIAAAIMDKPKLLILDEPFNGIDEESIPEIERILFAFKDIGSVIILSCHDMEKLSFLCDEIIKIERGIIS